MRSTHGLDAGTDQMNWRLRGNCNVTNAELFFVTGHVGRAGLGKDNHKALDLCRTCAVLAQCYADARDSPTDGWRIAGGQVWRPTSRRDMRAGAVASATGRKTGAVASGTAAPVHINRGGGQP